MSAGDALFAVTGEAPAAMNNESRTERIKTFIVDYLFCLVEPAIIDQTKKGLHAHLVHRRPFAESRISLGCNGLKLVRQPAAFQHLPA